ncbi:MAG: 4Fe-4S binding protein [Coriobacteriales bacterium]|jgi:anaerobic dimethyl sulfoxide reductase subunit B (iron-sulfur subunit)|nr:4Fe-4S binding protein [Coriobacteriales bacterium]
MGPYGFYVNTDNCIGCKACMTACFDRNNLEAPQKFRKVWEFGGGEWTSDESGVCTSSAFAYYVSLTCNQCDVPACVPSCPSGALVKDAQSGIVSIDREVCIGCMTCETSCPYHHPVQLADGLAHKCTLCNDESAEGVPNPVCAKACPMRVLEFGEIAELRATYGENAKIGELGDETAPNVVIGSHRDASQGGSLLNPTEISH